MKLKMFDKVKLKDGRTAIIVEIYEQGVAYEADISCEEEYITDTIKHEDILEVVE